MIATESTADYIRRVGPRSALRTEHARTPITNRVAIEYAVIAIAMEHDAAFCSMAYYAAHIAAYAWTMPSEELTLVCARGDVLSFPEAARMELAGHVVAALARLEQAEQAVAS